ncbi:hypothetical protein [Streptomyces sp. NPDC005336]|uniref:hypothetical protein n=1 Tax=Streptomyces sp. NPDC005336 TaxID=3157035 RepID=UPI0033B665F7
MVYWAARSNEFQNFLDAFGNGTSCRGQATVLGGNDVTNAVVEEQRPTVQRSGLRLYYAAHALPQDDPPNVMGIVLRDRAQARTGATCGATRGRRRSPGTPSGRSPRRSTRRTRT